MKPIRYVVTSALIFVFIYIASYFVLMDPSEPALDGRTLSVKFQSAFRFSKGQETQIGMRHLYFREVTIWNYIYWPMDAVYHATNPQEKIEMQIEE